MEQAWMPRFWKSLSGNRRIFSVMQKKSRPVMTADREDVATRKPKNGKGFRHSSILPARSNNDPLRFLILTPPNS
jgi:hypothetical protein